MSKIKYTIRNQDDEQIKNAAIEYVSSIQDFKEAKQTCEELKSKFQEKGYAENEIVTWIECEITIGSENRYSYASYAHAKTMHANNYQYISDDSTHGQPLTSKEYSKDRNIKGQKIIALIADINNKRKEKEDMRLEILQSIVSSNGFRVDGKEYSISEKTDEIEDEQE